ncbi:hypothetical protein SeMB42_g05309 [Synchytrium endobioticum]|uniref:Uncharacterized protein n=1 Tax=Synchytrium endobioticum TaxID=286115 RepID=A0A507CSH1_9FUNG|nr:hypothetical protein SeMB42_g05309 [Synchytrium endobioticum]
MERPPSTIHDKSTNPVDATKRAVPPLSLRPTTSLQTSLTHEAPDELLVKLLVKQREWEFCSAIIQIPKTATVLRLQTEICERIHGGAVSSSDILFLSTIKPSANNVLNTLLPMSPHQPTKLNVRTIETPPSELGRLNDCIPGVAEYTISTAIPSDTAPPRQTERPRTPKQLHDLLILVYDVIPSTPLVPRVNLNVPIVTCPLLDSETIHVRARHAPPRLSSRDSIHEHRPASTSSSHVEKSIGWRTIRNLLGPEDKLDTFGDVVYAARKSISGRVVLEQASG